MLPYWLQWIEDKASKLAMSIVSIMIGVQFCWFYGVLSFIAILTAILATNTILMATIGRHMPIGWLAISRWFWILLPAWIFLF